MVRVVACSAISCLHMSHMSMLSGSSSKSNSLFICFALLFLPSLAPYSHPYTKHPRHADNRTQSHPHTSHSPFIPLQLPVHGFASPLVISHPLSHSCACNEHPSLQKGHASPALLSSSLSLRSSRFWLLTPCLSLSILTPYLHPHLLRCARFAL